MISRCHHCKVGEHHLCWGVACSCLECAADDKDEFDWSQAA